MSSLTNRVTTQGATINSATLVNDAEIVATFAPLTAGTYTVGVSNTLGLSTGTGTVVAMDVPTYGALRSLAYDPERSSLYAANIDAQSVMSFHYSGTSGWAMLVGTWAIAFYQRHGFELVSAEQRTILLKTYWTIPERQAHGTGLELFDVSGTCISRHSRSLSALSNAPVPR